MRKPKLKLWLPDGSTETVVSWYICTHGDAWLINLELPGMVMARLEIPNEIAADFAKSVAAQMTPGLHIRPEGYHYSES